MTVFLGDLRSLHQRTQMIEWHGRGVGTRAAQDVYQKVLVQGENYSRPCFRCEQLVYWQL